MHQHKGVIKSKQCYHENEFKKKLVIFSRPMRLEKLVSQQHMRKD